MHLGHDLSRRLILDRPNAPPCFGVDFAGLDPVPRVQCVQPHLKIFTQFILHKDETEALGNHFFLITVSAIGDQPLHDGAVINWYFYGHFQLSSGLTQEKCTQRMQSAPT